MTTNLIKYKAFYASQLLELEEKDLDDLVEELNLSTLDIIKAFPFKVSKLIKEKFDGYDEESEGDDEEG